MAVRKRVDGEVNYGSAPPGVKRRTQPVVKPLTLEQATAWLGLAIQDDGNRPVLSWANKSEIRGLPAVCSADGYRIHCEWEHADGMPNWVEFKDSVAGGEEGKFPDMGCLIPINTDFASVYVADLIPAFKRAMVFSRDSANCVKIILKDHQCIVSGYSSEYGDVETTLRAEGYQYPLTISVNGAYMLDALKGFVEEALVSIHYVGNSNPIYVTDVEQKKRLALMMPMRTNR